MTTWLYYSKGGAMPSNPQVKTQLGWTSQDDPPGALAPTEIPAEERWT